MSLNYQETVESLKRMIADDQKAIEDTRSVISRVESQLHRLAPGQNAIGTAHVDRLFPTFAPRANRL